MSSQVPIPASVAANTPKKVTTRSLRQMKQNGEKIAVLTAYDACFAHQLDQAGVDIILVGDSLGMVIQGQNTTVPVSVDDMIYHSQAVARGLQRGLQTGRALLMVDMPFMSYVTPNDAAHTAARLMAEGGAEMVKLEGGSLQVASTRYLSDRGIPVCAHLGLTPQSVHKLGGYRVQGREAQAAETMLNDAERLAENGADMLLLECVPNQLAQTITANVDIPVIGIGAGPDVDAQVLVLYDILGISGDQAPKFAKNFIDDAGNIPAALKAYVKAVKQGQFPAPKHCFT